MAHMSKLEPSILVIPNSQIETLVNKALEIVIEYLQENFAREVVDCHSPVRPVLITGVNQGANVSFRWNVS